MLKLKNKIILFIASLLIAGQIIAQHNAEINVNEQTHDFGQISEADGLASHIFEIKNTGNDPLVINRITASCGCTRPEWSKAPIEPGKTGEVKISYNPKGRPGPFYKSISVFSNAKNGRLTLYVKGTVKPKSSIPSNVAITYPYNIGGLKLQSKSVLFNSIRPDETLGNKIAVKNEGDKSIHIIIGKIPNYLSVELRPKVLNAGETGEINVLFNTNEAKRMGHISTTIPLKIEREGIKDIDGKISVAANVIDNFSKWSSSDRSNAASIQFSTTLLDFGKLPEKSGGIIPFIGGGGKESESFTITNIGKSNLLIYSVTCDNELVDISGGKKELKPGTSASYKVSVHPKEIKTKFEAFINVVCNDPNGPVRLIKVTAEK